MNLNKYLWVGIVVSLLAPSLAKAEQYLCIADSATWFWFNEKTESWERASFKIDNHKYVIAEAKIKNTAYEVTRLGAIAPILRCDESFDPDGVLFCMDGHGEYKFLRFNKNTGRYLIGYLVGYYDVVPGGNESDNTPWIEIGKCSPF